ncbi:hypothetical protein C2E23DRAFT_130511 [Lenzites betulinus]|nr:hypothetical protein C2E23DRAFT_130511 [Lenzites betulinus]
MFASSVAHHRAARRAARHNAQSPHNPSTAQDMQRHGSNLTIPRYRSPSFWTHPDDLETSTGDSAGVVDPLLPRIVVTHHTDPQWYASLFHERASASQCPCRPLPNRRTTPRSHNLTSVSTTRFPPPTLQPDSYQALNHPEPYRSAAPPRSPWCLHKHDRRRRCLPTQRLHLRPVPTPGSEIASRPSRPPWISPGTPRPTAQQLGFPRYGMLLLCSVPGGTRAASADHHNGASDRALRGLSYVSWLLRLSRAPCPCSLVLALVLVLAPVPVLALSARLPGYPCVPSPSQVLRVGHRAHQSSPSEVPRTPHRVVYPALVPHIR